jgi:hypothetical protein
MGQTLNNPHLCTLQQIPFSVAGKHQQLTMSGESDQFSVAHAGFHSPWIISELVHMMVLYSAPSYELNYYLLSPPTPKHKTGTTPIII